jgi:murein DD-endopeptidase MepM/ murein hydrolase activator NlpD
LPARTLRPEAEGLDRDRAHAENLITWYAHVDNSAHPIPVRAGAHVATGQIIAYEGMTGRTTGAPPLDGEFNGDFVNPRLFL